MFDINGLGFRVLGVWDLENAGVWVSEEDMGRIARSDFLWLTLAK